ncbi:MAG: hypothetical protein R2710_19700 [Acidimicrobiales bacterium]
MSAGRTLAIMVLALGLAAVFNAGRQAERASQQPLGASRDRALAIWEPIDAVASPLGLEAPRSVLEVVRYGHTVTNGSTGVRPVARSTSQPAAGPGRRTVPQRRRPQEATARRTRPSLVTPASPHRPRPPPP